MEEERRALSGMEDVTKLEEGRGKLLKFKIKKRVASEAHAVNLPPEKISDKSRGLEEGRGKLLKFKIKKRVASEAHVVDLPPEMISDKSGGLQELKGSIEKTQLGVEDRLSELEDERKHNLTLSKQLEDLENETRDGKFVCSCLSTLLEDQLHHWNAKMDWYISSTDSLQADRPSLARREKELERDAESADNLGIAILNTETRVEELELKLQNCMRANNDLEIKMEEAVQDLGRKDVKEEFNVMTSTLSKRMEMKKAQLNWWKDIAHEAHRLSRKAQSLNGLMDRKTDEVKDLQNKCAQQMVEIKSHKELIEKLQKENLELETCVGMHGQGICDERSSTEIQESEQRAHSQAEALRHALNENDFEIRVRAAHDSEMTCQGRLSAAEAEIADLWNKLDSAERSVRDLREAIRIKDIEAEACVSEIETIGQAYEDIHTRNERLSQKVAEATRDEFGVKLMAECVKFKQSQSIVLSEKEALSKQLQQVTASLESLGITMARGEEQMKAMISEAITSTQKDRHLSTSLEFTKMELADTEKELEWLSSSVISSEKEDEQNRLMIAEIQMEIESERNERTKLEEEIKQWTAIVDELSSQTGEIEIQKLQEEIKECKAALRCAECLHRPKEVIIVKCLHLFCNQCIQTSLKTRHRRCPCCGAAFGQNDILPVNIPAKPEAA